jgi:excisionase family DNA binding protein
VKPNRITYSVAEAAAQLGVSRATFYRHAKAGLVHSFVWGGRRLIRHEDLKAAMDAAAGRSPAGGGQ